MVFRIRHNMLRRLSAVFIILFFWALVTVLAIIGFLYTAKLLV